MIVLSKDDLRKYAICVQLWHSRFDTKRIADHLGLEEYVVAAWIANFRDMGREAA